MPPADSRLRRAGDQQDDGDRDQQEGHHLDEHRRRPEALRRLVDRRSGAGRPSRPGRRPAADRGSGPCLPIDQRRVPLRMQAIADRFPSGLGCGFERGRSPDRSPRPLTGLWAPTDRRQGPRGATANRGFSPLARVYVIELDRGAGRRRDARIPWVYVGSSARDPEIRFRQHLRGYKSSGLVKRFALHLRPDLYEDLPSFKGATRAREAELERARELADCGFVAHMRRDRPTARAREAGANGTPRDSASWATTSTVGRASCRVDASRFRRRPGVRSFCTATGGSGSTDFIDPADPPPAYGRFAHVALDALEERVCLNILPR